MLDKNIEEGLKKMNARPQTPSSRISVAAVYRTPKSKGKDFDWLHLKTKNEMLKEKLKTKLVQTIN